MPDSSEWAFPNRATPLGSPNYYAVRFSPPAQRERNALFVAWYELLREIGDRPHDPGVARLKLDWWREETARLCHGSARHPLALALQGTEIAPAALAPMHAIIDAVEDEIRTPCIADLGALTRACRGSLGNFFVLLAAADAASDADPETCTQAGAYCAAVERIRCAAQAPHRLPGDLQPQVLASLPVEQRRQRCDGLLDGLRGGAMGGSALPDLARRMTALAAAMHSKIRRRGYPVADTLVARAPIAHLWTAWRCR